MGDDARRLFGPAARLIHTFWSDSYIDTMKTYHEYLGREPYATEFPDVDSEPYPEDWRIIQQRAGISEY
jgi:hypothetical protein